MGKRRKIIRKRDVVGRGLCVRKGEGEEGKKRGGVEVWETMLKYASCVGVVWEGEYKYVLLKPLQFE